MLLDHPDLAGIHFTGSTGVFNSMWQTVGQNLGKYRGYPRLVGETGGKDFIVVHASADPQEVAVAAVRGAFEFQGQKCSAASRMYVPKSQWNDIRDRMVAMMKEIKVGDVRDFRNFMGAVIDKKSFDKISGYIDDGEEEREGDPGRRLQGRRRLLHRADARRIVGSLLSPAVRGDLRAGAVGLRLRRCEVARDARIWSIARRRTR